MEKEVAKELASDIVTRNREKKHSRGKRSAEKNRERVHLQRAVSVKEHIEFSRKDICGINSCVNICMHPDGG